jgi:hypothetical protein
MLRELQHEHEVIHALLVDPSRTTAETMLELSDFLECGPVFQVLQEMENQLSQRTITQVVVRLKRKEQYDRRVIRRILSSDPTLALTHFAWACEEVIGQWILRAVTRKWITTEKFDEIWDATLK